MSESDKVLVIGDDTRSFLSTVRSLGRQGIEVHVAPFDFRAPALESRYIHATHFLPYYLDGGQAWLDAMRTLLSEQHFALVLPCDERGLLPLCLHRDVLSALARLAIPSPHALDVFFDKVKTRALARSLQVPVAAGRLLRTTDTVASIVADVGLPTVIKQPMSYALPELYARTSTKIVGTREGLGAWLAGHEQPKRPVLLESLFPGVGLGVSVLCSAGQVVQAFEHHRAHELDGSSYYRKSAPLDPARLAAVARMVEATAYTGLAMFEFKRDPGDGSWILIEVNARPWGSLPLPVALGVDFPYRLYRLLAHGEVTPAVAYPAGRYCRNLLQDFWQARTRAAGLVGRPGRFAVHGSAWLWSFHRIALGREHHDALVRDDPRPGLREIGDALHGRLRRLLPGLHARRAAGPALIAYLAQLMRVRTNGPVRRPIEIMFVCQGNINRSSYAELKSKQVFTHGPFHFSSSGMLPRNQRGSSAVAIGAAARHGINMRMHRSRHADAAVLAAADVVIVFDHINLKSIAARYPLLDKHVFLLGEVCSDADPHILDPEDKNEEFFLATYRRIDECLNKLAQALSLPGLQLQESA